uniref:Uncharacterized protein n=1 Tax=Oryza glumipatula TaxID=40148 RepID=A0A0D9YRM2_9ORYZ
MLLPVCTLRHRRPFLRVHYTAHPHHPATTSWCGKHGRDQPSLKRRWQSSEKKLAKRATPGRRPAGDLPPATAPRPPVARPVVPPSTVDRRPSPHQRIALRASCAPAARALRPARRAVTPSTVDRHPLLHRGSTHKRCDSPSPLQALGPYIAICRCLRQGRSSAYCSKYKELAEKVHLELDAFGHDHHDHNYDHHHGYDNLQLEFSPWGKPSKTMVDCLATFVEARSWSHANLPYANVFGSFKIRPCCIDQIKQVS